MLHSLEECVHLENDMFLVERGEYKRSPERLKQAKETLWIRFSNALTNRVKNIIISDVFSNPIEVRKFTDEAAKRGYEIKIIRTANFFENVHNVPDTEVALAYLRLQHNPIEGEILEPVVQPIPLHIQKICEFYENLQ